MILSDFVMISALVSLSIVMSTQAIVLCKMLRSMSEHNNQHYTALLAKTATEYSEAIKAANSPQQKLKELQVENELAIHASQLDSQFMQVS